MMGVIRQTNDTESGVKELESIGSAEYVPIVLIMVVMLQVKAHFLWSESRMLDKLRRTKIKYKKKSVKELLRNELCIDDDTSPALALSTAYTSLSKGRHHRLNRLFSQFYLLCIYTLDLINESSYNSAIIRSDAIIGIRLIIAAGSLAVLKVYRSTIFDACVLLLFVSGYVALCKFGDRLSPHSGVYWNIRYKLVLAFLGLGVIITIYRAVLKYLGRGTDIADIVFTLDQNQDLKKPQEKRLAKMQTWTAPATSDHYRPTFPLFQSYWSITQELPFVVITMVILMNSAVWLSQSPKLDRAAIIVQDVADFVSSYMLFLNDTQVEPALFVELLQVSNCEYGSTSPAV